ncbi:hypothetical protein [Erythrobacter sp. EC-HK427]|uniref:hypothetical protein n=1 Tax=Erythrobacter sp. EC-HK427 TaxID=2038396 RepID=UPI00125F1BF3|nr:hypothetical protein [Erythrobacter sp. EC-HK427]
MSTTPPPVWNLTFAHGTIQRSEASFRHASYTVSDARGIIWQIDRDAARPECDPHIEAGWEAVYPDRITYGLTPACYVETLAPAPLLESGVYHFESRDPVYRNLNGVSFYFRIRSGVVERASERDFARQAAAAPELTE